MGCRWLADSSRFAVGQLGTINFQLGTFARVPPFHRQHLLDDFVRFEVALPTVKAAGAEFATVGAADLRGKAERVSVTGFAVKRGIGRNQDGFYELTVGQPPEEFLRGVGCALFADESQRRERKVFAQLFAKGFWQVAHRVPTGGAAGVKPVQQLRHAVGRFVPRLELAFQFLARQGFDVRQHGGKLNGHGRKTKLRLAM